MSPSQHRRARPPASRRCAQRAAAARRWRAPGRAPSPSESPNNTALRLTSGRRSSRGSSSFSWVQAMSPLSAFHAVMRSLASAPTTSSASPPTACMPPTLRLQSNVPLSARRAATADWNARAQNASPTPQRRARPGRPAARPRWCRAGWPSPPPSARCRAADRRRSSWPLADQQRVLEGAPARRGCDSVSASPGRCRRHRRRPSSASKALHHTVDAHHEDAFAGHQRRGGDARVQALAPDARCRRRTPRARCRA